MFITGPGTGTEYRVLFADPPHRCPTGTAAYRYCACVNAGEVTQPTVRRARTSDVPAIKRLVDTYAGKILLEKNLVTLYEAVQEFWVAELDGEVIGCGALHVLWSDLGEVRTVAVDPKVKGRGVGHTIVNKLLEVARELALQRLFVLTFETDFFGAHGFTEIEGTPVTAEVYDEMCRSYDIGVAEFLDLSYVKPNILGNTRMLLVL
jgi:amino-acid N-acetyltransferase